MSPVLAKSGENLAKQVGLGDGAVDVRDDELGVVGEEEDAASDLLLALEASANSEADLVFTVLKVHLFQLLLRGNQRLLVLDADFLPRWLW